MRISDGETYSIRKRILNDLFSKEEQELEERKTELARQNLLIRSSHPSLQHVPDEMIPEVYKYSVKIRYNLQASDPKESLDTVCTYTSDTAFIAPYKVSAKGHWSSSNEFVDTLFPELYTQAKELCDDIIRVREERRIIDKFLETTLETNRGYKKLQNVWPQALFKYIPIPKNASPNRKKLLPDSAKNFPIELKRRMLTVLLDGE